MTSQIIYKGDLRTTATHLQSGTVIETDAPTDNQGKGERFSPTDLVATGLGTCIITTMAIKARTMNIALDGARVDVTKIMASEPRRIGTVVAHVFLPAGLDIDANSKEILERTGRPWPVERTLHPDTELDIAFYW